MSLIAKKTLGGRGAGFLPTDLANLVLWLDASDISTLWQDLGKTTPVSSDGDVVGVWDDKSGNNNVADQGTTASKPLYKVAIQNGLSVVRFDGSDDYLILTGLTVAAGSFSAFFVADITKNATGRDYFFDTQTGRLLFANDADSSDVVGWYDGGWKKLAAAVGGDQILTWILTSGGNGEAFRNGASLGTAAYAAKGIDAETGLGANFQGGQDYAIVDMMEVILYSSALSAGDRQKVESYLNRKWAIY